VTFRQLLQLVAPADTKASSRFEALITGLWILVCANVLVLFFVQGGYDIEVGPVHLHAFSLRNWLGLCLALSLGKAWMEERRGARSLMEGFQSALLLFIGALTVYYANGHTFEMADTLPARFLPVSILTDHDFYLDEYASTIEQYDEQYFVRVINGHLISTYPPWGAVLSVPVYVAPVLKVGTRLAAEMLFDLEKRAGMLMVALSVLTLFVGLRRVTTPRVAWFIAFVYAFGTSSLSLMSQASWQHGPSQLFFSLTLYCLIRGRETPAFIAWAGLALGWAVICRPLNLVMALPIALYVLHKHREHMRWVLACRRASAAVVSLVQRRVFWVACPDRIRCDRCHSGFPRGAASFLVQYTFPRRACGRVVFSGARVVHLLPHLYLFTGRDGDGMEGAGTGTAQVSEPGSSFVAHSGRDTWELVGRTWVWSEAFGGQRPVSLFLDGPRPGAHASETLVEISGGRVDGRFNRDARHWVCLFRRLGVNPARLRYVS
jgi:hypothetical protein